jgi:Holliday junction DNA helicase RuvA
VIALLRGRVASSRLGEVVLDVGGVGYRVHVPPGAPDGRLGVEVTLHTSLAVREDALTLYGFADPESRDVFETLLTVSGVGPKVALAALGVLGVDGLRRAVLAEDVRALTGVPGVGRKGAQRIILELGEKLGSPDDRTLPGSADGPLTSDARAEVREALIALGYGPAEIARALDALPRAGDDPPEELVRRALRTLAAR